MKNAVLLSAVPALLLLASAPVHAERVRLRPQSGEMIEHPPAPCGAAAIAAARRIILRGPTFSITTSAMAVAGASGETFVADEYDPQARVGRWYGASDDVIEVRVSTDVVIAAVESAAPPTLHEVIRLSVVHRVGTADECRETWLGLGEVIK